MVWDQIRGQTLRNKFQITQMSQFKNISHHHQLMSGIKFETSYINTNVYHSTLPLRSQNANLNNFPCVLTLNIAQRLQEKQQIKNTQNFYSL